MEWGRFVGSVVIFVGREILLQEKKRIRICRDLDNTRLQVVCLNSAEDREPGVSIDDVIPYLKTRVAKVRRKPLLYV